MVNYFLLTLIRLPPNRPSLREEREKSESICGKMLLE